MVIVLFFTFSISFSGGPPGQTSTSTNFCLYTVSTQCLWQMIVLCYVWTSVWIRIQSYDSFLPVFLWLLYTLFASNFDGYHSMQLLSNIIVLLQHLLRQSSLLQMAFLLVHDFAKVNHVFLSNQSLHSSINVSTLKANIISDVKACVRSSRLKKNFFF